MPKLEDKQYLKQEYDPKLEEAVGSVFAKDIDEEEYGDDNELVY